MVTLLPVPQHARKARAQSTSVRRPSSIGSLARSHSSPVVDLNDPCDSHFESPSHGSTSVVDSHPVTSSSSSQSTLRVRQVFSSTRTAKERLQDMFPVLVSRMVDLWRALGSEGKDDKHALGLFNSPASTPRSSSETEYILPFSASPRKTAFDLDSSPSPAPSSSRPHSIHSSLLLVVILFPLSTGFVLLCLSTLPINFAWPRTLRDLAHLGQDLNLYSQSGALQTLHIIGVLSVSAVWKHAWSIPGSVLWNVLAGALFHPLLATLLMTVLTALGSVFATLLATPLAPILTHFFPRPVQMTRAALEGTSESEKSFQVTTKASSSSPAWVRLSVLRLVGVVPWSGLNIACGLTGVPLRDCTLGALIGSLPWTAVTCQIGDILQTVSLVKTTEAVGEVVRDGLSKTATVTSILTQPSMIFELVFLTVLSLAPILGRDYLRKLISSDPSETSTSELQTDLSHSKSGETFEEKELPVKAYKKKRPTGLGISVDDEESDTDDFEKRGRRPRRQRDRWSWQRVSASIPRWSELRSPIRPSYMKLQTECDVRA